MTISTTSNKVIFLGNGAQTSFQFSFPGVAAADISVTYTDPTGVETTLPSNQYTLTLTPAVANQPYGIGGTVVYNPLTGPIPGGSKLTIVRELPLTQLTSLQNQGSMWPEAIEGALDYLTMVSQQLTELFARALVVSVSDTAPNPLPNAAARANQILGFDSSGQPIATQPSSALVSLAMQPVVNAATLQVAQAAMGLRIRLTAPLILYVSNAGNDANNGLTVGTPFLTIQRAVNVLAGQYDVNGFLATIQLAPGTYNELVTLQVYVGWCISTQIAPPANATEPRIQGDPNNPQNYIITAPGGGIECIFAADCKTPWFIHGVTFSGGGVFCDWDSNINLGTNQYGLINGIQGPQIGSRYHSNIELVKGCTSTIVGNAGEFASSTNGGIILCQGNVGDHQIVLQGTPAFTNAFASVTDSSLCDLTVAGFSGAATGVRFFCTSTNLGALPVNCLNYPGNSPAQFGARVPAPTYNWYVGPSGSDTTGTGLQATPFATVGKAYAFMQLFDFMGTNPNIHLLAGVFSTTLSIIGTLVGAKGANLIGDSGAAATIINAGAADAIEVSDRANINMIGLSLNGVNGINVFNDASVTIGVLGVSDTVIFGTCSSNHMFVQQGGKIYLNASYSLAHGAVNHWSAKLGMIIVTNTITVTFSVALSFSSAVVDSYGSGSTVLITGITYANPGNVTGKRFNANLLSAIDTGTGTPNVAIPGTINGTTSLGAQAN